MTEIGFGIAQQVVGLIPMLQPRLGESTHPLRRLAQQALLGAAALSLVWVVVPGPAALSLVRVVGSAGPLHIQWWSAQRLPAALSRHSL